MKTFTNECFDCNLFFMQSEDILLLPCYLVRTTYGIYNIPHSVSRLLISIEGFHNLLLLSLDHPTTPQHANKMVHTHSLFSCFKYKYF